MISLNLYEGKVFLTWRHSQWAPSATTITVTASTVTTIIVPTISGKFGWPNISNKISLFGRLSISYHFTQFHKRNLYFVLGSCLTWIHSEWPPSPPCARCGTGTDWATGKWWREQQQTLRTFRNKNHEQTLGTVDLKKKKTSGTEADLVIR